MLQARNPTTLFAVPADSRQLKPGPEAAHFWYDRVRGFVYQRAIEKVRARLATRSHYFAATGRLKKSVVTAESQLSAARLTRLCSSTEGSRPGIDALEGLARFAGWADGGAVHDHLRRNREPYPAEAFPEPRSRGKRRKGRRQKRK